MGAPAIKNPSESSSGSSSSDSSSDSSSKSSSSSSTSSVSEDDDDDIADKTYVLPKTEKGASSLVGAESSDESDTGDSSNGHKGTDLARKRKSHIGLWKRSVAKRLRNSGKEYISKSEKVVKAKALGAVCNDKKCRHKCPTKVPEDQRKAVFDDFWKTGDLQRQREFVSSCMQAIEPRYQYKRENSNRKPNNSFYLTINGTKTRVCKIFFKNTLAITDRFLRTVLEKKGSSASGMIGLDCRGKHEKHRKTDAEVLKAIKEHINSIPRMESHYCRKDTKKEYIEGGRTIMDLYRDFVELWKMQHSTQPANYQIYAKVFNNGFNISFFQPKKDQCEDCAQYENAVEDEKAALELKYQEHQKEKILSRGQKEDDKKKAKEDNRLKVIVYDLQAVMQCPRGNTSAFYYVSKINAFNFTVCDLATNNAQCYTWDEAQGRRGANEIATCLWLYITQLDEDAAKMEQMIDIIFYSDNCCGQNKNRCVFLMYEYAVRSFKFVNSITHNFLVKGHTQNEGDSVHATIQREITKSLKRGPIYTPQQYVTLMRSAKKKGSPYAVKELCYDSFLDFKDLSNNIKACGFKDSSNEGVRTSDIAVLRVEKSNQQKIFFKYKYSDEQYRQIDLVLSQKRNTRGAATAGEPFSLNRLYDKPVGLDQKKKDGLLKLVEKNIIPKFYASFYNSL